MNRDADKFTTEIMRAWPDNEGDRAPTFTTTWRAAEGRYARARRRHRMLAGAAAVVAAAIVGLQLQSPPDDGLSYIEVDELMGSTSWTAPSDVLLVEHEFDIYQEMPMLFESTQPAGGSLL